MGGSKTKKITLEILKTNSVPQILQCIPRWLVSGQECCCFFLRNPCDVTGISPEANLGLILPFKNTLFRRFEANLVLKPPLSVFIDSLRVQRAVFRPSCGMGTHGTERSKTRYFGLLGKPVVDQVQILASWNPCPNWDLAHCIEL